MLIKCMVRFLIFRAMQYRCMAPSILERRSMRNEIDKKIKQLQSCTLAEYDAMGGHIRNHVMAEQDALASLAQKKMHQCLF